MKTEDLQKIAKENESSQLTRFFELNQNDPRANAYTYDEILQHYTWKKSSKQFVERVRNSALPGENYDDEKHAKSNQIGRMPIITLNPYTKELFFLRMLLHNVAGPKSFEHIRTVDGHIYETYQDVCIALGLFEDDKSIEQAFEEGAAFKVSENALLHLFVTLCIHAMPANANAFWEKYKEELCSWRMHLKKVDDPTPEIINEVLLKIQALFEEQGKDMTSQDYKLPAPTGRLTVEKREVAQELDYNHDELAEVTHRNVSNLNEEQLLFWNALKEAIDNESGDVFGLQASGMYQPI